jgi:crossover junction endodeoxyribonuclease RuvC
VREATPNEVKLAVTGYGAADKEQVARMVAVCLGLAEPPRPDDTADALAVAIWAANSERSGTERRSSVLDRASVDPIVGSGTGIGTGTGNGNGHGGANGNGNGWDRAVKEAIAREEAGRRK